MRINTGAGQWAGVTLVVASCALLGLAVPRYASSTESSNVQVSEVAAGTRVSEGAVSIEPGDGWSRSTEVPGLLLLTKGDATLIVNAPVASTGESMAEVVGSSSATFAEDATVHYEVGDPTPFETTSGLEGAELLVVSRQGTTVLGAVTDGEQTVQLDLDATTKDWPAVSADLDAMLASIAIDGASSGAGSAS